SIYAFSTGDIFLGTGLAILYGLIVLQRQLIKPKVLSSSLGISPLMTLLTMYAGFKLLGFVGIILGPLLFILLKTFHETGILRDIWRFILGTRGKIERKSEEHTSELQSRFDLVCRLLLEKKKKK